VRERGFEAQIGARGARFEFAGERSIERGDGDVDTEVVPARDVGEQRDIAGHQIRLGGDVERETRMFGEGFENGACAFETAFGGLVGIGRGADGDAAGGVCAAQFAAEDLANVGFRVDAVLKIGAVAQFHEFMGIPGIAITAAKLTTPVRVDTPRKRHAGPGPVEHAAAIDLEIPDGPFGFQDFAFGRKASNTDQTRRGRIAEQQHTSIFAFYSPVVKLCPTQALTFLFS